MIIVVSDENDVLIAGNQKVVYDLLEWTERKNNNYRGYLKR